MDAPALCDQIRAFLSEHGQDPKYRSAIGPLRDADRTLRATYSDKPQRDTPGQRSAKQASGAGKGSVKNQMAQRFGASGGSSPSPFTARQAKKATY